VIEWGGIFSPIKGAEGRAQEKKFHLKGLERNPGTMKENSPHADKEATQSEPPFTD